jgi:hypothetical protein
MHKTQVSTLILSVFFAFLGQSHAQTVSITCSEINYNSHPSRASGNWLELYNYGSTAINLGGFRLQEEGDATFYTIPANTSLPAGGLLVLSDDVAQFSQVYPAVNNVIGPTGITLGNNGDTVLLLDNTGAEVLRIGYLDNKPWPQCADGAGRTLENRNPTTASNLLDPANWRDGCMGGSPGTYAAPCAEPIFFNEVNYNSNDFGDAGDWVEIWNRSGQDVNMSGWQLRDRKDTLRYTVPDGTILQKDSFLVFYSNLFLFSDVHPSPSIKKVGPFLFGLSSNGDILRLFDQNKDIVLSMSYDDAAPWPLEPDGEGPTLELRAPFTDLNTPQNWAASCGWGTPGRKNSPCSSSTGEQVPAPAIAIAPNPSTGLFQVAVDQEDVTVWQLLHLDGRLVRMGTPAPGEYQWDVDAATLPFGTYLLRVQGKGWVAMERVVKR